MVDSISSAMMVPLVSSSSGSSSGTMSSLTDEQSTALTDILSSFDSESLTESDALEIVSALSEAGIEPGAGLEEAMSEAGFDARAVGDLAGVGQTQAMSALDATDGTEEGNRPPPPPPQGSSTESDEITSYMADLIAEQLESSDSAELTDEELQQIQAVVAEEFGLEEGDSLIDIAI